MKKIIYILNVAIFLSIIEAAIFVNNLSAQNTAPPTVFTEEDKDIFPPGFSVEEMEKRNIKERVKIMNKILKAKGLIARYVEYNPLITGETKRRYMLYTEKIVERAAQLGKKAGGRMVGMNPAGSETNTWTQYSGGHLYQLRAKLNQLDLTDKERQRIEDAFGGNYTKYKWILRVNEESEDKLGNHSKVEFQLVLRNRKSLLPEVSFTRSKDQVYGKDEKTGEYGKIEVTTNRWEDEIKYVPGSLHYAVNYASPQGRKRTNAFSLRESSHQLIYTSQQPDKITEITGEYKYDMGLRVPIEEHFKYTEKDKTTNGENINRSWEETRLTNPDDYIFSPTKDGEGVSLLRKEYSQERFNDDQAPEVTTKNLVKQEFDEYDRVKERFIYSEETSLDGSLDRKSASIDFGYTYDPVLKLEPIAYALLQIQKEGLTQEYAESYYEAWKDEKLRESVGISDTQTLKDNINELDKFSRIVAEEVLEGKDVHDAINDVTSSIEIKSAGGIDMLKTAENWVGRKLNLNNPEDIRILKAWEALIAQMAPNPEMKKN